MQAVRRVCAFVHVTFYLLWRCWSFFLLKRNKLSRCATFFFLTIIFSISTTLSCPFPAHIQRSP